MLRLDVLETGIVGFQLPNCVGTSEADDLDQALRLLSEGGCRAVVLGLDQIEQVTADALTRIADSALRTLGTPMHLVLTMRHPPAVQSQLQRSPLSRFHVFRSTDDALAVLRTLPGVARKTVSPRGVGAGPR